jgi:signal transduction histidine kinase
MQIVLNFLTNAIKFTDKGGILVSFGEHDGYIWIRVADSGRGISSRKLEQIFEPFVQLRNRDALQGLGIGLATGMRLAQSMGGRISVTSEVGKGSAFTLRIPKVVESMKPLED